MEAERPIAPNVIAERARTEPDRVAVQCVDGTEATFADFAASMRQWAGALRRLGVEPGDHVATMLPHSWDSYLAWLGTAWLRAVEVPLNSEYRGAMLGYVVGNADARVVVISARYVARLAEVWSELPRVECVVVPDGDAPPGLPFPVLGRAAFLDGAPPVDGEDEPPPQPHDIGAIIYTSGTTGPSKGVLVPWASLHDIEGLLPADAIAQPDSGYYSVYPGFHLAGKAALCAAFGRGARLVFRESFSATRYWDDVRAYRCEFGGMVGPIAAMLMEQPARPDDADSPLRGVIMAPLIGRLDEFRARFGLRVCSGYGMTEIGYPLATGWDLFDNQSCGRVRTGPPGFEAKIVDDLDHEVQPGVVGELVARTRDPWIINAGYWGMPDKTADAWRNGWFHTGDGFRRDADGNFYFVDRIKDAIRRRGENISSFEVEAAVLAHPEVLEAGAIGVPSELSEDEVMIFVQRVDGSTLTEAELVTWLIPRMPRFMVPRYVEMVETLPKTEATQRVRKHVLREHAVTDRTWDRERSGIKLPRE